MATVCGGVFGAVVSVSVPLFGVKGAGGGGKGGLYVHQNTFALSKHTPTDSPEHNSTSPVSLPFHPPSRCF